MRQAGGVDHGGSDTLGDGGVDAIDQRSFMIALERGEGDAAGLRLRSQAGNDIGRRAPTIGCRLAGTRQVQIRSAQDQDPSPDSCRRGRAVLPPRCARCSPLPA
jgi:hypothetical protein